MKEPANSVPFKMSIAMRKIQNILWISAIVLAFTACTGIYEDGGEIAKQLESKVEQINVEELNTKIDNGDDFILIDVRQPNEYYTNNIPGSVLLSRGDLEFNISDEDFWFDQYLYPPDDTTEIVIYCKSGKRGILATATLMQLGFTNVKNLKGGYAAFNPNQDPNAKASEPSGGCGG